jgi:hypothetical protein
MSLALTNPAAITPPRFSAGLQFWSQTTGRPGTPTYAAAAFAAFVPSDPDFDSALEVQKTTSVVRLRWMGAVPIQAGTYLRVRARIKGMAGALPAVRIAAWAGTTAGVEATGITTTGPETTLTTYGEIVEVSAIIGNGARPSVTMAWPLSVQIAHFGLDLTGANGGVVRIDELIIEDVTPLYATEQIGVVDVRDYGALGDGTTDDRAAFLAAMAAAGGRPLLIPSGVYRIASDLTVTVPVIFRGTLSMPDAAILILQRNFDQPSYASAFGNGETGFRKGLQALFHTSEHIMFDLKGRRVLLSAPVDVRTLAGIDDTSSRRILINGQLDLVESASWDTITTTRVATYNPDSPLVLTGVTNVAAVPVGSRVSGVGVGREVYVRARNIAAGTLTLSLPLFGGAMTQSFTFERFQYALDFSGFSSLRNFEFENIEFLCRGRASCVMMPEGGRVLRFRYCDFDRPRDRAITSIGVACQGLMIDNCQFSSSQMTLNSQDRTVIAFNINSNDAKIRNNRVVLWAHFGVLAGTNYLISGNHFFQGDNVSPGIRQAGVVLTRGNVISTISGNYIDNCFIEMTNEHSATPNFTSGFSFGGLTVTGNIFFAINVAAWFSYIVFKPYGTGHFIQGLTVTGNVFRQTGLAIDRVERVDTTYANLSFDRTRNLLFHSNTFNSVNQPCESPAVIVHDQTTAATTWTIDTAGKMPFGGRARTAPSMTMEGPARDANNVIRYDMPHILTNQGPNNDQVRLVWPVATRGLAIVTVRVDRPL